MTQSLRAVSFDYTDDQEWTAYFRDVAEFVSAGKRLRQFREELARRCHNRPFDELQEQFDYRPALFGGVDEDAEYRERSLAKLYSHLLGLQFESLRDATTKHRREITPTTTVVVTETPFVTDLLSPALDRATTALRLAHDAGLAEEPPSDVECEFQTLLSDHDEFVQLLADVVNSLQRLLPNYNEKSLFVWTLDKTPVSYLSTAYPGIDDPETWEQLCDTLGLEPAFVPNIKADGDAAAKQKRLYSVYSYQNPPGSSLVSLYSLVWDAFDGPIRDALNGAFPEVPDYRAEFVSSCKEEVDKVSDVTFSRTNVRVPELDEKISMVASDEKYSASRGDTERARYNISGISVNSCTYKGYNTSKKRHSGTRDCDLSLPALLDELAPWLFLLHGLEFELDIDQDSFEIEEL